MKRNYALTVFFSLILLSLTFFGCLNYEQSVKLNADGSGTIKIHYWTKESNVMSISKFSFEENEIKTDQYKPEVVKSVKIESDLKDSTKHVYVEFDFKNINKLDSLKGFKDNSIKFAENGDYMTLTHTLKKDSSAKNFGMDEYTLKYTYEFPSKPELVDAAGKIEGNVVKWEYKYSELGNRDIVMTASIKKPSGNSAVIYVVIILIVVGIVVFFAMKSGKKPGKPEEKQKSPDETKPDEEVKPVVDNQENPAP
jgi:hypothetical protein